MGKNAKDLAAGICLLCISVIYCVLAQSIKVFTGIGATPISAKGLPIVWAVCLGSLAIDLILRGARGIRHGKDSGEKMPQIAATAWVKDNFAVLGTFAALFIYALCWKSVGYLISTVIYLFIQIQLLTDKERRGKKNVLLTLTLSLAFTFLSYYIFVKLLSVQLPRGIFAF